MAGSGHRFEDNFKTIFERMKGFGPKSIHSVLFVTVGFCDLCYKPQCFTITKNVFTT
jgi:hypothetical protein